MNPHRPVNYYNEFDPKAAAWLRQLIADGAIPNGHVDERSITEVRPSDLAGYTQCHFFAGIGGWSLALDLAQWPRDRFVWTGSCPCQPFSSAGKQRGTEDERHLWPVFFDLIRECRPATVFGEQVSSKLARENWLPGVRLDLESVGYAVGAADLCSPVAGQDCEGRIVRGDQAVWEPLILGSPHIRQRLYWVADADNSNVLRVARGRDEGAGSFSESFGRGLLKADSDVPHGTADGVADARRSRREVAIQHTSGGGETLGVGQADVPRSGSSHSWQRVSFAADCLGGDTDEPGDICSICGPTYVEECQCPGPTQDGYEYSERDGVLYARRVDHPIGEGPQGLAGNECDRRQPGRVNQESTGSTGPTGGLGIVLLPCRDGKTRRAESGIFPLADGLPRGVVPSGDPDDPSYCNATSEARAVRLKGYGNAIDPRVAALFITSYTEAT